MPHAIRFEKPGDPAVMRWVPFELPPPGEHEVCVRQQAVGLNFIDTYHRSGLYPLPLPSGLGVEAAGIVERVGSEVTEFREGDRVAYAGGTPGAYAELRNVPAASLVPLPEAIDFRTAAALMLKGLTAQYLLRRTFRVQPGDTLLVHAAAGGVGLILCQWAKALGATVIGTVGDDEKAVLARAHGCDHAVIYTRENFVDEVREVTEGQGVRVVYDAVGRDTFEGSLACLKPLGLMVSYGNASGPVPPFDVLELSRRGSLFLTRPTLGAYTSHRADLLQMAGELFGMVASGKLRIEIRQTYDLRDAVRAHSDLEARRTTGSSVLMPDQPH